MKIIISDYSHAWPAMFEKEHAMLATVITPERGVVEHVGSTSVAGLAAKPIIDIMIGLHDHAALDQIVPQLVALGYEYIPKYEDVMPYRRFFKKWNGDTATHHIHMVGIGGDFWDRHRLFRDYLRAHPDAVAAYASHKRSLAEREWESSNDYAAAKTDFIRAMERRALEWRIRSTGRAAHEFLTAHRIASVEELESMYGAPSERSIFKEIDHISDHYRAFIEAAPFAAIASSGPEGLDCSPRGDAPGFVRVADARTLMIPDRRGNNRIDTLRNIVRDPRVALLFLIPGIGETLRVNGRAMIVTDRALCASFEVDGKIPKSVIVIAVERVFFQCRKALERARLWSEEAKIPRSALPSTGTILEALAGGGFDGDSYDSGYADYMKQTLY
jgi:PPOX class probable FMN-dependent enzyme